MSPEFHQRLLQQIVQKDNLLELLGLQTRNLTNPFEAEDEAVKAALAGLVGEMNFQVDPRHGYRKQPGTAWIGITIGWASP